MLRDSVLLQRELMWVPGGELRNDCTNSCTLEGFMGPMQSNQCGAFRNGRYFKEKLVKCMQTLNNLVWAESFSFNERLPDRYPATSAFKCLESKYPLSAVFEHE